RAFADYLSGSAEKEPLLFPLPPERTENISRLLGGVPDSPMPRPVPRIILAPKTVWRSKHWPLSFWQAVIAHLIKQPVQLILIGAATDQNYMRDLLIPFESASILNLCGQTELVDLYALFRLSDVVIGLDSAPLHIANAVSNQSESGKPYILGLYGPTAPKRTG